MKKNVSSEYACNTVTVTNLGAFKTKDDAILPSKGTEGSACFDVKACFSIGDRLKVYNSWNKETYVAAKNIQGKPTIQLHPEHRVLIPTGLIFDVPENYVLKMYIRSSVALTQGLVLSNGVGVIDSDYTNESYIMLTNASESLVNIYAGERYAQVELQEVVNMAVVELEESPQQKADRKGGFGSTGRD